MQPAQQTHIPKASEQQMLRHSWGIWGLLTAIVLIYLPLLSMISSAVFLGGGATVVATIIVLYVVGAIVVSSAIFGHDRQLIKDALLFRQSRPFEGFGYVVSDFQHVFVARDPDVLREVVEVMNQEVTTNLGWDRYEVVKFTDNDPRLTQQDVRSFITWRGSKSRRGGSVFLFARASQKGAVCSLQWWLVLSGVIDRGRVRAFLAWSPVTLPFWIIAWLRGRHNVAANLRQVYPSFYETIDVLTSAKSAQRIALDTLVNVLNRHGIDTSDLKLQTVQAMSFNISGGQVSIGNIVQGARNMVAAAAQPQGAKSG